MENASYISLTRQVGLLRKLDSISNNLANLGTTGFKSEDLLFRELVQGPNRPDKEKYMVSMSEGYRSFNNLSQGSLKPTGSKFDIGLQGEGFLVVNTPLGERYTRAGNLTINDQGNLSTQLGYEVQGESGPIQISEDETNITISSDGQIVTSTGPLTKFKVVSFTNPENLQKVGNGLYIANNETPSPDEKTKVVQGFVEESNVTPVVEITKMIDVQREFEAEQSLVMAEHRQQLDAIRKIAGVA